MIAIVTLDHGRPKLHSEYLTADAGRDAISAMIHLGRSAVLVDLHTRGAIEIIRSTVIPVHRVECDESLLCDIRAACAGKKIAQNRPESTIPALGDPDCLPIMPRRWGRSFVLGNKHRRHPGQH